MGKTLSWGCATGQGANLPGNPMQKMAHLSGMLQEGGLTDIAIWLTSYCQNQPTGLAEQGRRHGGPGMPEVWGGMQRQALVCTHREGIGRRWGTWEAAPNLQRGGVS